MSAEKRSNYRPVIVRWLVILAITAILFALIMVQAAQYQRINWNARRAEAKHVEQEVVAATKAYVTEYGTPVSGNPAQILGALSGQNQRAIVFFEARSTWIDAKGELIDPWGTPYRFDISDPKDPRIWSCGPNRKDEAGAEDSDDIVSWR